MQAHFLRAGPSAIVGYIVANLYDIFGLQCTTDDCFSFSFLFIMSFFIPLPFPFPFISHFLPFLHSCIVLVFRRRDGSVKAILSVLWRLGVIVYGLHSLRIVGCVCCSVDDGTTAAPDGKTCSSDEFTCGDGTCIPLSQRCDWTEYHCPDGTDEFDCRTLSIFALLY